MAFTRMRFFKLAASLALVSLAAGARAEDRAAWMAQARWGVMTHYLADWIARRTGEKMTIERWNDLVDHFDVEAVAKQLQSVGAGYYQITIGQNSGYYLSPNATYDRLTGLKPGKCSRRDLVADLADALARRGIRLMVYLPAGAPNGDAAAKQALGWQNGAYRNREFQLQWEQVIREWSMRWGRKVSGWWFDGCYWPNAMYRGEEPNFATFAASARAGNPASALAFNPGVIYRIISITPYEDFTAGEIDQPDRVTFRRNADGKQDGAQIQVLTYLGKTWGMGDPRFSAEQVVEYSRSVVKAGGAITWDTPTELGGGFAPKFLEQLAAVGKALNTR